MKRFFISFSLFLPTIGFTQPYSVDWYNIAGGGGTSTGGVYSVSGTIVQQDAGAMSGGVYGKGSTVDWSG